MPSPGAAFFCPVFLPAALMMRVGWRAEYLLDRPENIKQAKKMARAPLDIDKTRRPHLSLKYQTPDEFVRTCDSNRYHTSNRHISFFP